MEENRTRAKSEQSSPPWALGNLANQNHQGRAQVRLGSRHSSLQRNSEG